MEGGASFIFNMHWFASKNYLLFECSTTSDEVFVLGSITAYNYSNNSPIYGILDSNVTQPFVSAINQDAGIYYIVFKHKITQNLILGSCSLSDFYQSYHTIPISCGDILPLFVDYDPSRAVLVGIGTTSKSTISPPSVTMVINTSTGSCTTGPLTLPGNPTFSTAYTYNVHTHSVFFGYFSGNLTAYIGEYNFDTGKISVVQTAPILVINLSASWH